MTEPAPSQGERAMSAEACRKKYELLIGPIRDEAKRLGYAVGVHGSIARDIDLIACPWTKEAVTARELANAIGAVIERVNGVAYRKEGEREEYFNRGCPGAKPHGRRGYTWHLGGGPYIDLSIMPRTDPPDMSGAAIVAAMDGVFYIGVNDETGKMEQVEHFRDKCKQKEVIPVVPKSALDAASQVSDVMLAKIEALDSALTAAIARAEQAEAACGEMRKALDRIASERIGSVEIWELREIASKALSSSPGKSTADEMSRLRRIADAAVRKYKQSMLADADAIYDMAALELDDAILL